MLKVQQYDLLVKYKAGKEVYIADFQDPLPVRKEEILFL